MADLGLQTFDKLYPMLVKKYKNLSIDQNADIPDKINQIVNQLNALGKLSNDVVRDWNTVYNWVMNDGLTTDVNNKIEEMNASGELNSILTSLFNSEIGDLTTLQTADKDTIVHAINDNVASLTQSSIKQGDLTQLNTTDKTSLVNAIKEIKTQSNNNQTSITNIGNASPKGTYTNLSALQTAFPSGTTGIYLTTDTGHWYYWNGSAWTDGGVYQSSGISDSSITLDNMQNGDYLLGYIPSGVESSFPAEIKGDYKVNMNTKSVFTVSNGNLADKLNIPTNSTTASGITVSTTPSSVTITGTASANLYFRIDGSAILSQGTNSGLGTKNYTIPADGSYKMVLYPTQQTVTGTSPSINIRKSDNSGNLIQLLLNATSLVSTDFSYVDAQAGALYLYIPSGTTMNFVANIALVPSINKNYGTYVSPSNQSVTAKNYIGNGTDVFILSNNSGNVYGLSKVERQMKISKVGKNLTINIPCKASRNFVQYLYTRFDDDNHKFYQWRVSDALIVDQNYNTVFAFDDPQNVEWEGAVWESGQTTFIGGYHGYETNQTFHILIDGLPYDVNGNDFIVYAKNEIRITNTSVLYHYGTSIGGNNVFNRQRVNVWTKEKYTIENKWTALQTFHIQQGKFGLMSCKYNYTDAGNVVHEIVSNARTDHDYLITNLTQPFYNVTGAGMVQTDINRFELFGNTSGVQMIFEFEYLDNNKSQYPNRQMYIQDFSAKAGVSPDQNRCKAYFDMTGDYTMAVGEVLRSRSTIRISA